LGDWEREPSGLALSLQENELLNEIFDALEDGAKEAILAARQDEDDKRRFHAMEANAIRSVRRQLAERASGKAKPKRTDPAA